MKLSLKLAFVLSLSISLTNSLHLLSQIGQQHLTENNHYELAQPINQEHQINLPLTSIQENHQFLSFLARERTLQQIMQPIKGQEKQSNQIQQQKQNSTSIGDNLSVQEFKKEQIENFNLPTPLKKQDFDNTGMNDNQSIPLLNNEQNQEIIKEKMILAPVNQTDGAIIKPTDPLAKVQNPQALNSSVLTTNDQQKNQKSQEIKTQQQNLLQNNTTENSSLNKENSNQLKQVNVIHPSVSPSLSENAQDKQNNILKNNQTQVKNNELTNTSIVSNENKNESKINNETKSNQSPNQKQMKKKVNNESKNPQKPNENTLMPVQPIQNKETQTVQENKVQNISMSKNQTQSVQKNNQNPIYSQQDGTEKIQNSNNSMSTNEKNGTNKSLDLSEPAPASSEENKTNQTQTSASHQKAPQNNTQKKEDSKDNNSSKKETPNNQQNKEDNLQNKMNKYYRQLKNFENPFSIPAIVGLILLGIAALILLLFCIRSCCKKSQKEKAPSTGTKSSPPSSDFDHNSNIFSEVPPSSDRETRGKGYGRQKY